MGKTAGRNKHQKAAHRPGERKISREQVAELLELSCSSAPDDRLVAAQLLCPCHVRTHVPGVWDVVYRMMSDPDRRVRYAAWHTLEDGGLPQDSQVFANLEHLLHQETDPNVRKFAEYICGAEIRRRNRQKIERLHVLARPVQRQRGKCDFCGERDVFVEHDYDTMISAGGLPRTALICDRCAQHNELHIALRTCSQRTEHDHESIPWAGRAPCARLQRSHHVLCEHAWLHAG